MMGNHYDRTQFTMSMARKVQQQYILLQAELYHVNQLIERNLDRKTGKLNPEAVDVMLRKERDGVLRKMIGYKR